MAIMISTLVAIVIGFYIIKGYVLKPSIRQGEKSKEIAGVLQDGTTFHLSDLKGQFVLLDFWGSWCAPCIQSHPALVSLYQQYHGKSYKDASGFEIVSIAVESKGNNWSYIIEKDNLNWKYHLLADNLFESPVVKAYNVKQLPTLFLINPECLIIAVDPSLSDVSGLLTDHLRK